MLSEDFLAKDVVDVVLLDKALSHHVDKVCLVVVDIVVVATLGESVHEMRASSCLSHSGLDADGRYY